MHDDPRHPQTRQPGGNVGDARHLPLAPFEPLGDYDALLKHAETYQIGDVTVGTISLDDLIKVKEHIRRTKDKGSLFQLAAIRQIRNEKRGKSGEQARGLNED